MTNEKACLGIWTPVARVLCYECHGPIFPSGTYDVSSDEWKKLHEPVEVEEDSAITYCDGCNKDIQIYTHIAKEHNLVKRLRELGVDAEMAQTGGMNSAVLIFEAGVTEPDYEQYEAGANNFMIVYDLDGENSYDLSHMDKHGEAIDEGLVITTKSQDELVEYIMSNIDKFKTI